MHHRTALSIGFCLYLTLEHAQLGIKAIRMDGFLLETLLQDASEAVGRTGSGTSHCKKQHEEYGLYVFHGHYKFFYATKLRFPYNPSKILNEI